MTTRRSHQGGGDAAGGAETEAGGPGAGASDARKPGGPGPRGSAWRVLGRMLWFFRYHPGLFALVAMVSIASAAFELVPPWMIRLVLDRAAAGGTTGFIVAAGAVLMGFSLIHGATDFARLYLSAHLGQRTVFRIRTLLFAHLSRLSFSFYDSARTGDLVSRVTADVDTVSEFFGRSAVIIATNVLFLAGVLAVVASWSPQLALVYVALLPFIVIAILAYGKRVRPAMGAVRRNLAGLTAHLDSTLAGIRVVKSLGREEHEMRRFAEESGRYREATIGATRITAFWMPVVNVIIAVGTAAVLWGGGYGVMQGSISVGMLVGFTVYVGLLMRPIRQTGMMVGMTMRSLAAAERVFEVLDTEPEVTDRPGAKPLVSPRGAVSLDEVTFSYDGENSVLRDVSFNAEPGEFVALVGPSGAGKSTLVHLLARFYEADAGTVRVDGHDVRDVTLESLRDAVGIAFQDVFLFDATIRDNIGYGNPNASPRKIEEAARTVQLHDFIASLPEGYDTPVGERGVRLSGGQRQRLALARVLLRDPPVLILDEPTSSLDAETERKMSDALDAVARGRTTIVIAHRLWTVHHADRILVLRDGRLVEQGARRVEASAHEELMARDGLYRSLYALQFRDEGSSHDEREA